MVGKKKAPRESRGAFFFLGFSQRCKGRKGKRLPHRNMHKKALLKIPQGPARENKHYS
jgi:hypothetical protein